MQATVATYDEEQRSGTVLLDDGVVLPFGPGTVRADVRHLRPGQRVSLEVDHEHRPESSAEIAHVVGVSIH